MITKTVYQCEVCGKIYSDEDSTLYCERVCKISNELGKVFGNDEWCPPSIRDFHKWNNGDKNELARKILHIIDNLC